MIKEDEYYSKVIETKFNKPLEENEVKGKDHDQITKKYQGSVHQECNLNLSLSKKILAVFHNLQNYDSHLISQEVGKYNFKKFLYQKQRQINERYY